MHREISVADHPALQPRDFLFRKPIASRPTEQLPPVDVSHFEPDAIDLFLCGSRRLLAESFDRHAAGVIGQPVELQPQTGLEIGEARRALGLGEDEGQRE